MIVLDANILIRAILGRRVRQLLEEYATRSVQFLAPDAAYAEVSEHLPALLKKMDKPRVEASAALEYLNQVVESVDQETYGPFEKEARLRLRGRDEDDWPVLATALALSCPIWSEDTDFFGTGAAVWTTSRVEILLKSQVAPSTPFDE